MIIVKTVLKHGWFIMELLHQTRLMVIESQELRKSRGMLMELLTFLRHMAITILSLFQVVNKLSMKW